LLKAGRYDAALKEYFNGLKSLKLLPKEHEDLLERLIATHPATVKLDTTGTDVGQGLRHYGAGLELFNAARYENAEEEFTRAAAFDTKDARYRYFLGLARWLQNKKEAATDDFKAGAALESQSRPASRVINASLERIQGPTRDAIETYRP
jgi:tetratricopeptide (TPR) repeat protein